MTQGYIATKTEYATHYASCVIMIYCGAVNFVKRHLTNSADVPLLFH